MRPQVWNKSRVERLRYGITLDELADASGVPHCYLSEAERNVRRLRADHERARASALNKLAKQKGAA